MAKWNNKRFKLALRYFAIAVVVGLSVSGICVLNNLSLFLAIQLGLNALSVSFMLFVLVILSKDQK